MAEPQAFLDQGPVAPPPDPDISYDPQGRPRITIRPTPGRSGTSRPAGGGGRSFGGSIEDAPAYVSAEEKRPTAQQSIEDAPAYVDTSVPMQPEREVSSGQALAQGVGAAIPFSSAIQGLQAAAQAPGGEATKQAVETVQSGIETVNPFSRLAKMIGLPQDHETLQGLARLFERGGQPTLSSLITGKTTGGDPAAQQAFVQGRDTAQETQDLAAKQHPGFFYPGMVAGTLALPVPGGPVAGAGRVANAYRLAKTGAALGGVYGVSEGVNRGESAPEIATRGAEGAGLGFVTGGAVGTVLPSAAPRAVLTDTQRAQQTATRLGEPLGRGLASANKYVRGTTAKLRGYPFAGEEITENVQNVQKAAGRDIKEIAGGLTEGASDRASADTVARAGLKQVVEDNKETIRKGYADVRSRIDEGRKFTLPETKKALDEIVARRRAAHYKNPEEGLDEVREATRGSTFEGAHDRRELVRNEGKKITPHPGFDAGQWDKIARAMSDDLRGIVRGAAHGGAAEKKAAVDAYEKAERDFGPTKELNQRLTDLVNGTGEGSIGKLLGATKEKSGDVRLLAQLQRTMSPEAFQHLTGQVLHELSGKGEFSLQNFSNGWRDLSPRAKDLMFSPQHRADIEDIVHLGGHIKKGLQESSTSHSASLLVLLELASHIGGELSDIYAGTSGAATYAKLAAPFAGYALTRWLASPAKAAAIGAWTRAYRVATVGQPTPARIAAFKIATRNLASNINLPVEDVMRTIQKQLPAAAQPSSDNERPEVPRPR